MSKSHQNILRPTPSAGKIQFLSFGVLILYLISILIFCSSKTIANIMNFCPGLMRLAETDTNVQVSVTNMDTHDKVILDSIPTEKGEDGVMIYTYQMWSPPDQVTLRVCVLICVFVSIYVVQYRFSK